MKKVFLALLFSLLTSPAWAAICATVPFVFTPGTTIFSSQVNSNFSSVVSCVNSGAAATPVNSDITSLAGTGTGVSIAGTNTNNNAAGGFVGEIQNSNVTSGSAVSLTTVTSANVTSVSLTAGDWDCWGTVNSTTGGSTVVVYFEDWISTTSAATSPDPTNGLSIWGSTGTGGTVGGTTGVVRISIAGTTTVYMSVKASFSASTLAAYGQETCRRAR